MRLPRSKQRRRNIQRKTSLSFLYMLENAVKFDPEEIALLFGKSFSLAMVQESETLANLSIIPRSGIPTAMAVSPSVRVVFPIVMATNFGA